MGTKGRKISWNVRKVPREKLLATIASLNEILINYSTTNRLIMSNCLINLQILLRMQHEIKVKIQQIYSRLVRRTTRNDLGVDSSMVLQAVEVLCWTGT